MVQYESVEQSFKRRKDDVTVWEDYILLLLVSLYCDLFYKMAGVSHMCGLETGTLVSADKEMNYTHQKNG